MIVIAVKVDLKEEFLTSYKKLEELLYSEGLSGVRGLEESLPDTDSRLDRLRIVRQMRNFMVHHENPFVGVSQDMIDFVNSQIKEIMNKNLRVSDLSKKVTPLKLTDNFDSALKWFVRKGFDFIPITDKDNSISFILDRNMLIKGLADSKKFTNKLQTVNPFKTKGFSPSKLPNGVKLYKPDVFVKDIPLGLTVIMTDIDNKNTYKGMFINE